MSTPSRDPEEGPDSQHAPGSGPAGGPDVEAPPDTPAASDPAETRLDMPSVTDHEDTPPEREPSGALAPEEMAFVPARDAPDREEPAYDTFGHEEPGFDTLAPETPEVAEAVHEAEPNWPPLVRRLTLGQAIVLVTGVLLFVWGFLPWYSDAGGSANAWSTVTIPGLLLTATWVPLLSLAIVLFVAIKVFGNGFPDTVLGFTWAQLAIVVGFFDVLITLGFLVANRSLGSLGSLSLGPGLILSFVTALVLLGGAVMDHLGRGADFFRNSPQRPRRARRGPAT